MAYYGVNPSIKAQIAAEAESARKWSCFSLLALGLGYAAFWAGVIWIIAHFIRKFW